MFSLTRRRREAERNKKLEEAFREADVAGKGMINKEQLIKLFAVAEVLCKFPKIQFDIALIIVLITRAVQTQKLISIGMMNIPDSAVQAFKTRSKYISATDNSRSKG